MTTKKTECDGLTSGLALVGFFVCMIYIVVSVMLLVNWAFGPRMSQCMDKYPSFFSYNSKTTAFP